MNVEIGPRLRPYMAVAVRDLIRRLEKDAQPVPGELVALLGDLWPEGKRHATAEPAAHRRELAAARTRRWRARQRGEAVPLRQPGRPKKRHKIAS